MSSSSSYDPSYEVKMAHQIPPVSNFDSSSQYYNNLYIFPAIYLVFGVLAVFLYQGILFVNCAQSARIKRGKLDEEEIISTSVYEITCKVIFYLSIATALTLNALLFLWYFNLSNSMQTVATSLGLASNCLSPVVSSTNTLTSQLNVLFSLVNKTVCETAFASVGIVGNLTIATIQAKAGISGINAAVCNAPSVLNAAQIQVSTSYILLKDTLLLGIFAVVTVVTTAVGIASLAGSKGWLVSSVLTSEALVLLLTTLCAFEMLAVVSLCTYWY